MSVYLEITDMKSNAEEFNRIEVSTACDRCLDILKSDSGTEYTKEFRDSVYDLIDAFHKSGSGMDEIEMLYSRLDYLAEELDQTSRP